MGFLETCAYQNVHVARECCHLRQTRLVKGAGLTLETAVL